MYWHIILKDKNKESLQHTNYVRHIGKYSSNVYTLVFNPNCGKLRQKDCRFHVFLKPYKDSISKKMKERHMEMEGGEAKQRKERI